MFLISLVGMGRLQQSEHYARENETLENRVRLGFNKGLVGKTGRDAG